MRPSDVARPPRSPATSPAQYPAGSGVGVSVLLRQPHGFEGFCKIPEVFDLKDHAVAHRVDGGALKSESWAVSFTTPDELSYDPVTGVYELGRRVRLRGIPGQAK